MKLRDAISRRDKLAGSIESSAEILRGSFLQRTIRHEKGCQTCARGEGHCVFTSFCYLFDLHIQHSPLQLVAAAAA
jgi:hypothetical protein